LTADVYDSAGNTRTNAAGMVFRYNADNQLTNVVNGSMTIAILYNADGHRVRKSVTVGGTTTETYYLIDLQTPTGYAQVKWTPIFRPEVQVDFLESVPAGLDERAGKKRKKGQTTK
jgi:YD repeat-containing protein